MTITTTTHIMTFCIVLAFNVFSFIKFKKHYINTLKFNFGSTWFCILVYLYILWGVFNLILGIIKL